MAKKKEKAPLPTPDRYQLVLLDYARRIGVMDIVTGEIVRKFDTKPIKEGEGEDDTFRV